MNHQPHLSICEFSMISAPFEVDLRACKAAGLEGVGVCEAKFPAGCEDQELVEKLYGSGLKAAVCLPAVLSILPLPKFPGPSDPQKRVEGIINGIRRLAAFKPGCCFCLTGPQGHLGFGRARSIVVGGLRKIARAAAEAGVQLGVEPIHTSIRSDWTMVSTLSETLELIEEVGEPNLGIGFDTWHLGDTPNVLDQIRQCAKQVVGVHVSDKRHPTRSWADRVMPGEGTLDLPTILGALEAGGYTGWYDLEVLSDNGTFGNDFPDSLWKLPPEELARRGRETFLEVWKARKG